jgi:hypothetical protein
MSRDDFTKDRLAWLEQVAEDPKLPAAAKSIAIKLCTKYLSRRYGAAWPGVESLALDIRTTARTVQLAMRALVECGHLSETARRRQTPNKCLSVSFLYGRKR